ncbi:RlpA-like double-psi beta-barrel-protein domain-containing protein-containing protein [Irpex rosettiformis]|uniref:RlpA-like double-psi beta-barrel-protein domain-containing protein-containing protein n=1 Tax=Irpex rosettiformis TaxID=378272 RepID=A0ACB8TRZ4_9APHY|nr:RlpA-like double-psi beta-barrel-protein domain-containing protein-containing protein [Irpex rosettiformis]
MARFAVAFLALSALVGVSVASPIEKRSSRGTWFNTGLGACGWTNVDSDKVIALAADIYDGGAHCGKSITITNDKTGATATGTVADECPGCGGRDLDLTPSLFQELGNLDEGVLSISWKYN